MILLLCTLSLVVSFFTVSVSSECVSGTFASHPDSCDKYLVCGSEGEFYEMPCSPGTWFNPDINVCDWPTDVTSCVNGTRTTTSNPPTSCECKIELAPIYHLERPSDEHHFYTPSKEEADRAVAEYGFMYRDPPGLIATNALDCNCRATLKYPTRMFRVPTVDNPITDHFFTLNGVEIGNYINTLGYRWENWDAYRFYCSPVADCGASVPLHRYLRNGKHYFATTTDGHEDSIYEGIMCYIWPLD